MERWTLDDVAWVDVTRDPTVSPVQQPEVMAELEGVGMRWLGRIATRRGPPAPQPVEGDEDDPGAKQPEVPDPPDRVLEVFLGVDTRTWIEVEDGPDGPWCVAHTLLEDGALVRTVMAPELLRGGWNPDGEARWMALGGLPTLLSLLVWLEGSPLHDATIDRPGVRQFALACERGTVADLLRWHATHVRVRGAGAAPVTVELRTVLAVARRKDHVAAVDAEAAERLVGLGSVALTAVEFLAGGLLGAQGGAVATVVAVVLLVLLHLALGRAWTVLLHGRDAMGPDVPAVFAVVVLVMGFGGLPAPVVTALVLLMLAGEAATRLLALGLRHRWIGRVVGRRATPPIVAASLLRKVYRA